MQLLFLFWHLSLYFKLTLLLLFDFELLGQEGGAITASPASVPPFPYSLILPLPVPLPSASSSLLPPPPLLLLLLLGLCFSFCSTVIESCIICPCGVGQWMDKWVPFHSPQVQDRKRSVKRVDIFQLESRMCVWVPDLFLLELFSPNLWNEDNIILN